MPIPRAQSAPTLRAHKNAVHCSLATGAYWPRPSLLTLVPLRETGNAESTSGLPRDSQAAGNDQFRQEAAVQREFVCTPCSEPNGGSWCQLAQQQLLPCAPLKPVSANIIASFAVLALHTTNGIRRTVNHTPRNAATVPKNRRPSLAVL